MTSTSIRRRRFSPASPSLAQLADLLASLRPIELDGVPKYAYGSAGGLYPVQVYLYVEPERVEGLRAGTYYYDPHEHQLVVLSEEARVDIRAEAEGLRFAEPSFALFLVGDLAAIRPMYGKLAEDFCGIEAGLITHLLETSAPESGLGVCRADPSMEERLRASSREWLALGDDHLFLESLLGGCVDAAPPPGG
jgi:SagB-type dehydrogenase family enzyme